MMCNYRTWLEKRRVYLSFHSTEKKFLKKTFAFQRTSWVQNVKKKW